MGFVIDERDGDLDAIPGGDPQVLAAVVFGLKPFNLGLLYHLTLPGIHVQLKQGVRCGHG